MLSKVLNFLFIPKYLRRDYDSSQTTERQRRKWTGQYVLLAAGLGWYQVKNAFRDQKQGKFYLFEELTGRKSILQKMEEHNEAKIDEATQDLLQYLESAENQLTDFRHLSLTDTD